MINTGKTNVVCRKAFQPNNIEILSHFEYTIKKIHGNVKFTLPI